MSSSSYKISATLYGHTADVRCLAAAKDGNIISGSRDFSARYWERIGSSNEFAHVTAFTCHKNFVSSICFLPPSSRYNDGVIVTGSNDKMIRCFEPASTNPFKILTDHSNTVCKLCPGSSNLILLSSSWDQTGRGWTLVGDDWTSVEYTGHSSAVWSICQLVSGTVVTASADKTLRVFQANGTFVRSLTGHTDCVRDVVASGTEEVLSVANDAAIRHWNVLSGECLNTYYGHGHYIYSIAILDGVGWVTSSEDRTVKVWGPQGQIDSITLPAASVWAVASLPNSDIVAGTNDGIIRVFSKRPEAIADAQLQAEFAAQLEEYEAKNTDAGGVKLSELPGKEALYEPGRTDGQTKMIRDGNKATAYAWSASEGTWQLIGDVVGAVGGANAQETGKPVYNGKEYDYVFNVDIEDGKPALKLPYNRTEDPWIAAQKFIHDNDLPQSYLEQVANFIMKNSDSTPMQVEPNFVDPFTGGTRYVPSNGTSGGDRGKSKSVNSNSTTSKYFPQREFLKFDIANSSVIKEKLVEFSKQQNFEVKEEELSNLVNKCSPPSDCSPSDLQLLDRLLEWPSDFLLPVLDLTRLLIRYNSANQHLCSDKLLNRLQPLLKTSPNNMLSLRIVSNMMACDAGEALASKYRLKLIEFLVSVSLPYTKVIQVAIATLMLNLSVLLRKSDTPDGRDELLLAAQELIPSLTETEALFRGLVALGTLLTDSQNNKEEVEPFLKTLQLHSAHKEGKIRECADDILAVTR